MTDPAEGKAKLLRDALERRLRAARGAEPARETIPRRAEAGPAPLSFAQQRLWFLDQLDPGSAAYVIPAALELEGPLDVAALERSLSELVRRHEAVRTAFVADEDGRPSQVVRPPAPVRLDVTDVAGDDPDAEIRARCAEEAARSFDLASGDLARFRLLRVSPTRHVLTLALHHVAFDGWSTGILVREVTALYEAFSAGRASPLPDLPLQYADYAAWQRGPARQAVHEKQLAYWTRRLAGVSPLDVPADRPRPASPSGRGASHPFLVGPETASRLRQVARDEGATPFMVLLAAYQLFLGRHAGQTDVAVGTPVAGRVRPELEGLVGLFVNTLVLRADLGGAPTFRDLVRQARGAALEAFAHQDVPFEQVVDAVQPERDTSRSPLFQASLTVQPAPRDRLALDRVRVRALPIDAGAAKFDLALHVVEGAEGLACVLQYSLDLFEPDTARRLGERFATLLDAAAASPDAPAHALPLLPPAERDLVVRAWNQTAADYPRDATVHELIAATAAREPHAAALLDGSATTLTFAELDARANRLANHLRALGVRPGDLVALCLDRSADAVVAMLGVLKAGAAYVPLDPAYPTDRLSFMLDDTRAPVVIAQARTRHLLPPSAAHVLLADDPAISHAPSDPPGRLAGPDDLAYVIYTSGSTGRPKGVMVRHQGLTNYLWWALSAYPVAAGQGAGLHSSLAFDLTVTSIFAPLLAGRPVHVVPDEGPEALAAFTRATRDLSFSKLTPSHLDLLGHQLAPHEAVGRVRCLVVGGEALLPQHVRFWMDADPSIEVVNEYGPTETVVGCCVHRVRPADLRHASIPIGRPIANTRLYVLDARGEPQPIGVPGELLIGGDGVARGYLNRAELTAERFVPDPFAREPAARLYRSGDLARWLPDGSLEYLGRLDDQVKVRGFRIELGEIEATLATHPDVREAAVVARADGPHGEKRLVAYVAAKALPAPSAAQLRQHVRARLPEHMVPAAFVSVDALPLTPNGKVDRKALPAPDAPQADGRPDHAAPRTPTEAALAEAMAKVLGIEAAGVHDNFFELGGDSILSIQLVARAARAGVRITPKQVFQHQTVAELAIVARSATLAPAEQGPVGGDVALAPIQRWFFDRDLPEPHHFNQAVLLRVPADLPATRVAQALGHMLAHHDALRLRYARTAEGWTQRHDPPPARAPDVRHHDLSALGASERAERLLALTTDLHRSLDLAHGPLLQAATFDLGPDGRRLFVCVHHLVVDGVSWRILLEDLETACLQLARGAPVRLPPKTTSYKAWTERLAATALGDAAAAKAAFWTGDHDAPDGAPLPRDGPGGDNDVASARTVTLALDEADTRALLQDLPRAYRANVQDALVAALARALARWTGAAHVRLDLEGHGREDVLDGVDLTRTVGWFTSLYPLTLRLGEVPSAEGTLKVAKERLRAVPDRGFPHGILLRFGDPATREALAAAPRAEVLFNYLGQFEGATPAAGLFSAAGEATGPAVSARATRSHAIEILAGVSGGRLAFGLTYSASLHARETAERLAADVAATLAEIAALARDPAAGGFTPSDFPLTGLDAATLDRLTAGRAREIEDVHPTTPLQQGMLFHSLYEPDGGVYFEQARFDLVGAFDADAFDAAWQKAAARHTVLRTSFAWDGLPAPLAVVHRSVAFPVVRLDADEAGLDALAARDRGLGFDPAKAPLARVTLARVAPDRHHLVWSFHHALLDGWSIPILFGEVMQLYEDAKKGRPTDLPPTRPFGDHVRLVAQRPQADSDAHWRKTLAGFTAPTPLGVDRPAAEGAAPGPAREERIRLPEATTRLVSAYARRERLTLNTLVQGAWALVLSRYSGEDDVCFGATVSGRPPELPGVERMVGLFINTIPVRVRVPGDATASAWLRDLQAQQVEGRAHEHTPLARAQAQSGVPRGTPLFESILVFENYPAHPAEAAEPRPGLAIRGRGTEEKTNYPITLVAAPGDEMLLKVSYDPRRLDDATARRLLGHVAHALTTFAASGETRLGDVPLAGAEEAATLLDAWNDTAAQAPLDLTAHELFAQRAAAHPDRVAVESGGDTLTYAQLDARAEALAARLAALGAGPDVVVGLCVERSLDLVVGMLGILKAGAAYLPLDPAYPEDRLAFMLKDAAVPLVVAHAATTARVPPGGARLVRIDLPEQVPAPARIAPRDARPHDLAYVIYTSGSTGRPKGVMIEHRGLVNLATAQIGAFEIREGTRVLQFASMSFDASASEVFTALLSGATLVLPPAGATMTGADLHALLRDARVEVATLPPTVLRTLPREPLPRLRTLVTAGEACPGELVAAWGRDRLFLNAYGPTEVTVCATIGRVDPDATGTPPIGRAIANQRVYLLDRHGHPAPVGVQGELHVGGVGLARGYLGRPELTAERFVPDPWRPGARLYRTGDLARWRPDGQIDFLGRADDQVKVRGFRIELGEIEAALARHPGVRDAAALAREDTPGDKRLVAYVVARSEPGPDVETLRAHLRATLPEHMVPSAFVQLDALPLTPNGKVDRKALPAPDGARPRLGAAYVAPRNDAERALVDVWQGILGVGMVGVRDDFFALGGDSILSIQVVARAAAKGLRITPKQVFQHPTIEALAGVAQRSARRTGPDAVVDGEAPLTPIQRWLLDRPNANVHRFNQSVLLVVSPAADAATLQRALAHVARHHDALRLRFTRGRDGAWTQRHAPASDPLWPLEARDLSSLPPDERAAELARLADATQGGLDVEKGPIARALLVRLGPSEARLLLAAHHLAVDGVSWRILLEDVEAAHAALAKGAEPALPPRTDSFQGWARRLAALAESEEVRAQAPGWLAACAPTPLPRDRPGENLGRTARAVAIQWDGDATRRLLQDVARAWRATPQDAMLAALARALADWTGGEEGVVDVESHGRDAADDVDLTRTVGWFTTVSPVRLAAPAHAPPEALVKDAKERVRATLSKGAGHGILRHLGQGPEADALRALPPPEVAFNYLGQFDAGASEGRPADPGRLILGPAPEPRGREHDEDAQRPHLLAVAAAVTGGRLQATFSYSEAVHARETIERVAKRFEDELRRIVARAGEPAAWGATPSDFPLARLDAARLDALLARHPGDVEDVYPLAPLQQGLLFHALYEPRASAYFEQLVISLEDPALDAAAFGQAWTLVAQRHAILRTSFAWEGLDEPLQIVHRHARMPFEVHDLRGPDGRLDALLAADRARGFDLGEAPLARVTLARTGDAEWRVVVSSHHLLLDGWSLPLVLRDAFAAYAALRAGAPLDLPPARPYRDFVAWLARQDPEASKRYWKEALAGFATPTPLVVDRAAQPNPHADGVGPKTEAVLRLPEAATAALAALARRERVTMGTVLNAAWAHLLHRYSGETDVCFGQTVSGRPAELPGVESMVGLFINTIPVRVKVAEHVPVAQFLRDHQAQLVEMRQHEHAPLVEVQGWSDVPRGKLLFESLVVFENYPVDPLRGGASRAATGPRVKGLQAAESTNYPLTLIVSPGAQLQVKASYDARRLDAEAVTRLLGHLGAVLEGFAHAPERPLRDVPLLTQAERAQLEAWCANDAPTPEPVTIPQLVERAAARDPARLAVASPRGRLTYGELDARANRIAHTLAALGAGPERVVAVLLSRGPDAPAAALGAMKAGAAYLPIDPGAPRERVLLMLEDTQAVAVLTEETLRHLVDGAPCPVVALDAEPDALSKDEARPAARAKPDGLALVLYTSGSTGVPKGVMLDHANLANFIAWHTRLVSLGPEDRASHLAGLAFDAAAWDTWPTLAAGASLHMPDENTRLDPKALAAWLVAERITVGFAATPLAERLVAQEWPASTALRVLFTGGERLRQAPTQPLPFALVNAYGPTEATVVTTASTVAPLDPRVPAIGRPITNARVAILDAQARPVPVGVPGELWVSGAGLARGYLRRPELTAEKFVQHEGRRWYRTGDVVRWTPEGEVDYVGRRDHQVKIRGQRVELGEIEATLLRDPRVREAVVTARGSGADARLVAYVVASATGEELRAVLKRTLPEHMVPAVFVTLDAMPLTRNGKVDRAALPEPDAAGTSAGAFEPPATPTEEAVAHVWRDLLGGPELGRRDDFFARGGHSLLAARLASRVREAFGVEVALRTVFEAPRLDAYAAEIERLVIESLDSMSEEEAERLLREEG